MLEEGGPKSKDWCPCERRGGCTEGLCGRRISAHSFTLFWGTSGSRLGRARGQHGRCREPSAHSMPLDRPSSPWDLPYLVLFLFLFLQSLLLSSRMVGGGGAAGMGDGEKQQHTGNTTLEKQPNSKDPQPGSGVFFQQETRTVHLSSFTFCPKMQKCQKCARASVAEGSWIWAPQATSCTGEGSGRRPLPGESGQRGSACCWAVAWPQDARRGCPLWAPAFFTANWGR